MDGGVPIREAVLLPHPAGASGDRLVDAGCRITKRLQNGQRVKKKELQAVLGMYEFLTKPTSPKRTRKRRKRKRRKNEAVGLPWAGAAI